MDSGSRTLRVIWVLLLFSLCATAGFSKSAPQATVRVLMVSDIHFEPFWDPGKASKLAASPESEWTAILGSTASPDREAQFAAVQEACRTRGADTSYPLFASSLSAMKTDAAGAKIVTVSGDLISHSFSCKFAKVFPNAKPADYRIFVEKTIKFVMGSLRGAQPGARVYAALGNNDTDCDDYQLDANSSFLHDLDKVFTADIPGVDIQEAYADFPIGGNYSATLPKPFADLRLLVIDDLFMANDYQTCAGKDDRSEATRQIVWLHAQLESARQAKAKVWVMAHIPPGIDLHATALKGKNICAGEEPKMFLSSDDLSNELAQHGDVISLAIFAHTHMDEMRLLYPIDSTDPDRSVPVKLVSSISPINGNNPSITVAQIDPHTGTMVDYRVIAASNQTGIGTTWAEEYDYSTTYNQPAFSAAALATLMSGFRADSGATSPLSQAYIRNYFVGDRSSELKPFWPIAACDLVNMDAVSFHACVCGR